jgi:hypothetical protein
MNLCEYKDLLGKPNEGLHSYRIFNVALVDVGLTVVLAGLFSYAFDFSFILVFLLLLLISIPIHRIFCVRTTVDKLLF